MKHLLDLGATVALLARRGMVTPADIVKAHSSGFEAELATAASLAIAAGEIALRYHGKDVEVEYKAGAEPVTVADRETSQLIVAGLEAEFPSDVVISEENQDDCRRLEVDRVWYVDPIDGTKNFIRGETSYCVMIGLAISHRPVLGVIYQPNHQSLVFACHGSGAWSYRDEELKELNTSSLADPGKARLLGSSIVSAADRQRIARHLGLDEAKHIGSIGMKLSAIALGASDLYINPATHCSSWDTCGPQIILEEAGGRITDRHGAPLRYDRPDGMKHQRGLIASNGPLHEVVVERFQKLFPGPGG